MFSTIVLMLEAIIFTMLGMFFISAPVSLIPLTIVDIIWSTTFPIGEFTNHSPILFIMPEILMPMSLQIPIMIPIT